ncbi:SH3 domain-containing protein [Maribacter ulvicola]|uniref:SH3 domain-containing protein n=1 Tax=Maribacter ulvicola TaxID=228959 RepID=A0A1N7AVD6_9FLAO|nr:SH3 domain-containing protein [Maribacter ulvicola]SIR43045.1 SH3 domain-containing protein [Maribacter ulvicola]
MSFLEVKSQDNELFFINASTGLIIREQANSNSKRIGKLPYGSTVQVLKKTEVKKQIIDNNDTINGTWVKIKYNNFPYIVSKLKSEYEYEEEGFVFNGFIEKLNKIKIDTKELDSLKFNELFREYKSPIKTKKITSIEKIKKLLASKVKWKDIEYLGYTIDEITLDNGQVLHINQKNNDYSFVAYYPIEEIILFEGGHTSDYSISIKTGESLETVGNPEYIVESPNKNFRLNGWFPGQECSSYFFQEKTKKGYRYLVEFGWGSENYGNNVCNFDKFCWINDNEFIYSYMDYLGNSGVKKYFKGKIVK